MTESEVQYVEALKQQRDLLLSVLMTADVKVIAGMREKAEQ